MDIKEKINEIVEKIKADKNFAAKFQKDPAAAIEEVTGIAIPKEQLDSVVKAVMAKVDMDKLSGVLGGLGSLLKK